MATTLRSLCRDYGILDTDTEQVTVMDLCLSSAVQYIYNGDIRPPHEDEGEDPIYDLMVMMLTTHWYDHRGVIMPGTAPVGNLAMGLDALFVQHGKNVGPEDTLHAALAYARGES